MEVVIYPWKYCKTICLLCAGSSVENITFGPHVDKSFLLNALANMSVELSVIMESVPALLSHISKLLDNCGLLLPSILHNSINKMFVNHNLRQLLNVAIASQNSVSDSDS